MPYSKTIFFILACLYILNLHATSAESIPYTNQFDDPVLAYEVLQRLDLFQPIDIGYSPKKAQIEFNKPLMGLKPDDEYCEKHRAYFVEDPSFIFERKTFITSYKHNSILRAMAIPAVGEDIMPHISRDMKFSEKKQALYDLRLDTNVYFIFEPPYYRRELDKQFSCLTQMSGGIPGHELLYRKDAVGTALNTYAKSYESRPQCFNNEKFFPKTWVLKEKDQCQKFFEEFNSPLYKKLKKERKVVYFRKVGFGVHQGMGVFPVDKQEEKKIREEYQNGELCGKVKSNNVMQYAIHNPLLLNGRKCDMRVSILVASTNPMIVYFNDGMLRVSLMDYDPNKGDKEAFVTNLDLVKHIFYQAKLNGEYNGMTDEELREQSVWTFERLHNYLYENGIVTDPNWLDNYLRPELKKMIIHLIRMSQGPFAKKSSLFTVFGLDILLDEDLNLWFLEANAKPGTDALTQDGVVYIRDFLIDSFEILFGLLRSRTKRIIEYVNKLTREGEVWIDYDNEVYIDDVETRIREFREITKNYFEPEFEPSPTNKFSIVIDENLYGTERYAGLIAEECL